MLVRFLCPACHQLLGIAPRKVGAQVNCPKCGATILVPDPEEANPTETTDPTAAADIPLTDFVSDFLPPAEVPAADVAASRQPPADAIGSDVLGDMTAIERPAAVAVRSISSLKRPPPADLPLDDSDRIVISRRVLYFQAALLAVVGILALVAGYLIGSGARLHGP